MNMSSAAPVETILTLAVASGRQVLAPFETTISKLMRSLALSAEDAEPAPMSSSAELTTAVLSVCRCMGYPPHSSSMRARIVGKSSAARGRVTFPPFLVILTVISHDRLHQAGV